MTKLFQDLVEAAKAEKRGRSLDLPGLLESASSIPPPAKQQELESKISQILDHLGGECRTVVVYRMSRPNNAHPRQVKLALPLRSHWTTMLFKAGMYGAQ